MFYVVSHENIGPNRHEEADGDCVEIWTAPAITNSSHEIRTEGWCGSTNDVSLTAHGEYETLEQAHAFVVSFMTNGFREEEIDGYEGDDVVARYLFGKYRPYSSSDSVDWISVSNDVEAGHADEDIDQLVVGYEKDGHHEGIQIDIDAVTKYLRKERDELLEKAREEAEDEDDGFVTTRHIMVTVRDEAGEDDDSDGIRSQDDYEVADREALDVLAQRLFDEAVQSLQADAPKGSYRVMVIDYTDEPGEGDDLHDEVIAAPGCAA